MKHTGLQKFTKIDVKDQADIYKTSIIDKLNIPIRRPASEYEFGDMFIETNAVNMVDSNNTINQLLDINNSDLIKSLLLSETFFDDQMNFDKTDTGSFNNKIDSFLQYDINVTYDTTTDQSSIPSIIINIDTIENGDNLYNLLTEYSSYNIPIRTELKDNLLNSYTYMIFYNSILYDIGKKELTILLNDDNNKDVLSDLTTIYIQEISLSNFIFTDNTSIDNYINIPYHYHTLNEVKDLDNNINNDNGLIKLVNGQLKFNFPQELNPDKFILENSFFKKDQINDLLKNKLFNLNITELSFTANVNYTDSTIDLGGGLFITEYYYVNTDLNINNNIKLDSKNAQEITNSVITPINITDQHSNSYLAQVVKFGYNNLINDNQYKVNDIISLEYQQMDKTSIDNNNIQLYDITDNTVTAIASYYDIQIVQPNQNTIPFILINNNLLYKDDYDNVQLSIPKSMDNIKGKQCLTINSDSDLYLLSDTLTFTIEYLDILSGIQETIYPNTEKVKIDRSRVNIIPSDLNTEYSIKIFSRT